MKTSALVTLALLPFTFSVATAEHAGTPAPAAAAAPAPAGVASLTDAECLALMQHILTVQRDVMLAVAEKRTDADDSLETHKLAVSALPLPPEQLPEDFRQYLTQLRALIHDAVGQMEAYEKAERELSFLDSKLQPARRKELQESSLAMEKEFEARFKAMQAAWPRAAMLRERWFNAPMEKADDSLSYYESTAEVKRFMSEHPELIHAREEVAKAAWLRHNAAALKPQELTPESARRSLTRMEARSRLGSFSDYRDFESGTAGEDTHTLLLPMAPGCEWKQETALGTPPVVDIEWHTMPLAELQKLRRLGLLSRYNWMPKSEVVRVAAIHMKNPGKIKLLFTCTFTGENEPMLSKPVEIHVGAPYDEDKEDEEDNEDDDSEEEDWDEVDEDAEE